MPSQHPVIRFGSFCMDLSAERLWAGSDPIALRPKTWKVLRLLVERAGQLVTKDELLSAVWGNVIVEEKAINTCIGEIRAALGDSSRHPRFIETVQRRGFRFLVVGGDTPAAASELGTPPPPPGVAFVGRRQELESLLGRLTTIHSAVPLTVVTGNAGIGKSRLLREAIGRSRAFALIGQCAEGGGLPYLPWVEMIREHLRCRPSFDWRTAIGGGIAEIERLIPGLQSTAAAAPPSSDPELARIRLFGAIAAFFEAAAHSEPITVVLEDIHWIDTASLRALQALLPRLAASRAHVLASLRDEDAPPGSPVRVALDTLMRRSLVELIPLSGLPPPDRRELIAHLGGAAMPQDLVDRIAQSSEGSPFFIEEILRQYSGTATSAPAAGNIDPFLPANVVEVFERRRRRLSTNTQQLLEAIAVAGSECDELLLENLLPFADGELADAINEAIEHKVLRENPTHPGRYGFEHALMALAIYQRLTPPLRRRWHRDLAEAIADGSGDRAGEIARHLLRAVPAVPVDTTVDALLQAAHQATARLAYEDAIDNCAKALELIGGTGGDTTAHPRLAEVAVRHAEALQQIAEADRIAAAFRDAATIARHSADPQWFARAALGMATIWDFEAPDVREYLEQALARIDDSQAALRARLLARLAVVLYPLPDTRPRCEELSTQAVTLARQVGDATLLAQTLVDWLAGQWYQDNLPAQESFSEELLEVARRSGDGALMATAHGWRVVIALDAGDIARAEAESEALLQLAEKSARPLYRWCALYLSGTLALLHGDLEGGELLANAAFEFGRSASPQNATIVYSSQMVAVRREQDRINEIIDLVEQNPQRMSSDALVWLLPHFYVEADRWEDGRAAFDRALALGLDALPGENSRNRRLMAIGAIALACAAFDDKRAAAKLYPVVEVNAARWAVAGWGAVSYGMLANAAGALATCLGKYEDAAAHFERAIGEYERKRVRIALARAYYMYADMHLRRGARGDARRGKDLLAKARAIADECKLVRTRKLIARLSEAHART